MKFGTVVRALYTSHPYKRTSDILVSPVHQKFVCRPSSFFSGIRQCFSLKKHQKIVARPFSPKLVSRPVFRPSFYTGGV